MIFRITGVRLYLCFIPVLLNNNMMLRYWNFGAAGAFLLLAFLNHVMTYSSQETNSTIDKYWW